MFRYCSLGLANNTCMKLEYNSTIYYGYYLTLENQNAAVKYHFLCNASHGFAYICIEPRNW